MRSIPAETWAWQHLAVIMYHNLTYNIRALQGHFVFKRICQSGPSNIILIALQLADCNQPGKPLSLSC